MEKLLVLLQLFNINFLILVLIQGFILIIYDYNFFKRENKFALAKRSRYLAYGSIIIAFILFITRKIILLM